MEREFTKGQTVAVTLYGIVAHASVNDWVAVNAYDADGDVYPVNVKTEDVEHFTIEPEAGQMYRTPLGKTLVVYREGPLFQGGKLKVIDVHTGTVSDTPVLLGARLVADSEDHSD